MAARIRSPVAVSRAWARTTYFRSDIIRLTTRSASAPVSRSARPRESVRPVGWSGASVSADDDRRRQLGQTGVDRHLPDGRFLAEPVEIGRELLLAHEERVTLGPEPLEVVAGCRHADALGQG